MADLSAILGVAVKERLLESPYWEPITSPFEYPQTLLNDKTKTNANEEIPTSGRLSLKCSNWIHTLKLPAG